MAKTGSAPAKSASSKITVGEDGSIVANHLRSLAKLPWSRGTKTALNQVVSFWQGTTTRHPKGTKRVLKHPAPAKPE